MWAWCCAHGACDLKAVPNNTDGDVPQICRTLVSTFYYVASSHNGGTLAYHMAERETNVLGPSALAA